MQMIVRITKLGRASLPLSLSLSLSLSPSLGFHVSSAFIITGHYAPSDDDVSEQ